MNPVALEIYRHKIQETLAAEKLIAESILCDVAYLPVEKSAPVPEFIEWCSRKNLCPLPALATTVAAYVLDQRASSKSFDPILCDLDGIAALHSNVVWAANPVETRIVSAALDKIAPADAIKPPRSWRQEERVEFEFLPRTIQAAIARREHDRDRALLRWRSQLKEQNRTQSSEAA